MYVKYVHGCVVNNNMSHMHFIFVMWVKYELILTEALIQYYDISKNGSLQSMLYNNKLNSTHQFSVLTPPHLSKTKLYLKIHSVILEIKRGLVSIAECVPWNF
jgi:hypothetical protein